MRAATSSAGKATTDPARERLIAEGRRRFFAEGFRRVTMSELASGIGMSKRTVYSRFASKTDLVREAMLQKLAEMEASLETVARESSSDFAGAVARLLECIGGHAAEISPAFLHDLRREAPEIFAIVQARRPELIRRHIGRLFEQGQKRGMVRRDITPELMVAVLIAAADGIATPTGMETLGLPPRVVLPSIVRVVLEGVLTGPGRKAS